MPGEYIVANYKLNTISLRCPEPIMLVRKMVRKMEKGEILYVVSDDPASIRDISSYCRHMDHWLIDAKTSRPPFEYWLRKKG